MSRWKLPFIFSILIIVTSIVFLGHPRLVRAAGGDVNNDGRVDLGDIILVLTNWLSPISGCSINQSYTCDQNGDSKTNALDFVIVINNLSNISTSGFPFGPFHYFETQAGP